MKNKRIISFLLISMCICGFICWIFWTQEIQYALPTPVPAQFVDVKMGEHVDLNDQLKINNNKPALLHFFNASCPCSRFNMQEFESMAHRYKKDIRFYVVLQSEDEDAVTKFKKKYELDLPVILDKSGMISDKCGIYSTPQAVILDKHSSIYFKGNYNASRYCTRRETRFVEMAIDSLVANRPLPIALKNMLTEPYGCTLPSDEVSQSNNLVFNLF